MVEVAPDETVAEAAPTTPPGEPSDTASPADEGEKPAAEKPIAEKGFAGFFKSLVDLITPGGEKPPTKPGKALIGEPAPEAVAGTQPSEALPGEPDGVLDDLKETIVEATVDKSDEIIVEVTGDPGADPDKPVEFVEEIIEGVPPLIEDAQETVTAQPQDADAPAKEEEEKGFLDRMASLFTADDKPDSAKTTKPGKGKEAEPKGVKVTEYELPLPPPKTEPAKNFSPQFLDQLADFLETGDEETFNAWLPEMQVMNAEALHQQAQGEAPKAAAAPDGAPAPAPDKSPKPTVETAEISGTKEPWSTAVIKPDVPPASDTVPGARPKLKTGPESAEATDVSESPEAQVAEKDTGEKPGMIKGVFNKLVDVLTPDFKSRERPERLLLDPDEKLAAADPTETKPQGGPEPPGFWPITEVEAAKKPVLAMKKPRRARYKVSLKGVTLTLGRSITLENSYPPGQGIDPRNQCVKKNRGTTLFCLETVDWPESMKKDFLVPTILYTGQKAIARYDQGVASRFHALFPSDSFKRIAQYFHERFGKPTDVWNRSIAPFAQPRQDNPTLAWRSIEPRSGIVTILEIRKYDDSRGGFPDTNRGAVMLYLANSPPIFPQVSSHELMRLSRGRLAPPPVPGTPAEPKAVPANIPDDEPPAGAPGESEIIEGVEEAKPKALKDMTSEEIQELRRKKKAAKKGLAPAAPPPGQGKDSGDDSFALPSDPLNR